MSDWMDQQFLLQWPNVWAGREWIIPACVLGGILFLFVLWAYRTVDAPFWLKAVGAAIKSLAILLLAAILVEPMHSDSRPVPGANLVAILADASLSLKVTDRDQNASRQEILKAQLASDQPWQTDLALDFDIRRYQFDDQLTSVEDYQGLKANGEASAMLTSLSTIAQRYANRPVAGVLLLTDGNATDLSDENIDWSQYPPIFPVILGQNNVPADIGIRRVTASQTNFEASPVTITAEISNHGFAGESIVIELLDEKGKQIQSQTVHSVQDDQRFAVRFRVKPDQRGVLFYQIRAYAKSQRGLFERPSLSNEATLLNNSRTVLVNRGRGPYKVLYVAGRPNWEFKFLNRAVAEDDEVQLHALIRIAKQEPRFQFREKDSNANRIFTNTDDEQKEQVEQYDEAVLLRVGDLEKGELSGGFPKSEEEIFQYHAIILDDIEADFFTQDQKSLIQTFVSSRGGGLMMLGGTESFTEGQFHRTPIGEVLPVYLSAARGTSPENEFKLNLTRDGKLEPWVRVRSTEEEEARRLAAIPSLKVLNRTGPLKPAATDLLVVETPQGDALPALITQRFGKGRTGALLIGDLWRWQLHRDSEENDDLGKTWRQTVRWLVGDVPRRVQVETMQNNQQPNRPWQIAVRVSDENYKPLDNATVNVEVTSAVGKAITFHAKPVDAVSGEYIANFVPKTPGNYRATVTAINPDGSEIMRTETGWVSEPVGDEFLTLSPNVELLQSIARETGGEVVEIDRLSKFVRSLSDREVPITEPQVHPIWHTWGVFLLAVGLLAFEWGLRRWKGLA